MFFYKYVSKIISIIAFFICIFGFSYVYADDIDYSDDTMSESALDSLYFETANISESSLN